MKDLGVQIAALEQHRLTADRHGQVGFADAGWPSSITTSALAEPRGRDLADLLLVDRGLGGEVEAVEVAQLLLPA